MILGLTGEVTNRRPVIRRDETHREMLVRKFIQLRDGLQEFGVGVLRHALLKETQRPDAQVDAPTPRYINCLQLTPSLGLAQVGEVFAYFGVEDGAGRG